MKYSAFGLIEGHLNCVQAVNCGTPSWYAMPRLQGWFLDKLSVFLTRLSLIFALQSETVKRLCQNVGINYFGIVKGGMGLNVFNHPFIYISFSVLITPQSSVVNFKKAISHRYGP